MSEPQLQTVSGHFRVKTGKRTTWNAPETQRAARRQVPRSLIHERALNVSSKEEDSPFKKYHAEFAHKEKIFEQLVESSNYGNGSVIFGLDVEGVRVTFTSFPKTGDVLVTGLKSEGDLKKAAYKFCETTATRIRDEDEVGEFSIGVLEHARTGKDSVSFVDPWVTDTVWTGLVSCRRVRSGRKNEAMVTALSKYFKNNMSDRRVEARFVKGSIPSAILRRTDLRGWISVYCHGVYVVSGVRDRFEATKLREWLFEIMAQHWTEIPRGRKCATTPFGPPAKLTEEETRLAAAFCDGSDEVVGKVERDTKLARRLGRGAVRANRQYLLSRLASGESKLTAQEKETLSKRYY